MRERSSKRGRVFKLVWWGLAAAAIAQELRKPAEDREWHGTVAGFVPYDYRFPTMERARDRLWNPDGPLLGPQVFGVGWSVNFGRVVELVREARAA
ncbi:MAG: DUF5808 domain-containing protein [Actinomycetota bacterium]